MNTRAEPVLGNLDDIGTHIPDRRPIAKRGPNNRPRKPWLAFVLGVLHPPLAFAYVGRLVWGIGFIVCVLAVPAAAGWSGWADSLVGFWLVFSFLVAITLTGIFAPWIIARGQTRIYELRAYNRWYAYVVLAVVLALPLEYASLNKASVFGFEPYRIPTDSMLPTIGAGDYIVADERPQTMTSLHAGDLVVTAATAQPGKWFARRVVGMPGQHVVVGPDGVTVDGVLQQRTHVQGSDALPADEMKFTDVTLGPDDCYLMADNRQSTFDSRTIGPHPRSDLRGRITMIWFSREWWRLGHVDDRP